MGDDQGGAAVSERQAAGSVAHCDHLTSGQRAGVENADLRRTLFCDPRLATARSDNDAVGLGPDGDLGDQVT